MSQNLIEEVLGYHHMHNPKVSFYIYRVIESPERNVTVKYDGKYLTSFKIPLHQDRNMNFIEGEFIRHGRHLFDRVKMDVHKVVSVREQIAKTLRVTDTMVVDVTPIGHGVVVDTLYHGRFVVIGYEVFKEI